MLSCLVLCCRCVGCVNAANDGELVGPWAMRGGMEGWHYGRGRFGRRVDGRWMRRDEWRAEGEGGIELRVSGRRRTESVGFEGLYFTIAILFTFLFISLFSYFVFFLVFFIFPMPLIFPIFFISLTPSSLLAFAPSSRFCFSPLLLFFFYSAQT